MGIVKEFIRNVKDFIDLCFFPILGIFNRSGYRRTKGLVKIFTKI